MSNNNQRNKRIFISDAHLGDERTLFPPPGYRPYGWMAPPRTRLLEDFLDIRIRESQDVKELIILGDFFEHWEYPVEFTPHTFEDIIAASQNRGIFAKLNEIGTAGNVRVIYVPGNHDMLIHDRAGELFTKYLPGIEYRGTGPGQGVYMEDGIAAEHGSMYDLFNSPDFWSHEGSWFPIGFYLSRLFGHKKARTGEGVDTWNIINHFIRQFIDQPEFTKALFIAAARDAGLGLDDQIIMNGLDNNPGSLTVAEASDRYPTLLKDWQPIPPVDITPGYALLNKLGLDGAAQSEYFLKDRARIVLFGHTHNATLIAYLRGQDRCVLSLEPGQPCDYIYANTGTWINSHKHCSYVETELNEKRGRHYVRLYHFSDSKKIKRVATRYIKISKKKNRDR